MGSFHDKYFIFVIIVTAIVCVVSIMQHDYMDMVISSKNCVVKM